MLIKRKRIGRHLAGAGVVLALGLLAGAVFPQRAVPQGGCPYQECWGYTGNWSCTFTFNPWNCALMNGGQACTTGVCGGGGGQCGGHICQQSPHP